MKKEIKLIEIEKIRPDLNQPRKTFSQESLIKLAKTIKKHGVIEPIIIDKEYKIIVGERRYRASKLAGLKKIPCIIREPKERLTFQLIDELHKEEIPPIDRAKAFKNLMKTQNLDIKQLSLKLRISEEHIKSLLRLLECPEEIKTLINQKKLTVRGALEVLKAPAEIQKLLWHEVTRRRFSVRQLQALKRDMLYSNPIVRYTNLLDKKVQSIYPILDKLNSPLTEEQKVKIKNIIKPFMKRLREFKKEVL